MYTGIRKTMYICSMKTYTKKGFEYFYDRFEKQWVLYPIDSNGNRIEWDANDNPIESVYFNNKTELNKWLAQH